MKRGFSSSVPHSGKKRFYRGGKWHDFLLVNKSARLQPGKTGNGLKSCNALILLYYLCARSMGNSIKNAMILEVGDPANSLINISVHIAVDVRQRPLRLPLRAWRSHRRRPGTGPGDGSAPWPLRKTAGEPPDRASPPPRCLFTRFSVSNRRGPPKSRTGSRGSGCRVFP